MGCEKPARFCEYSRFVVNGETDPSIAFYYSCEEHWTTPGPYGDTPEQRARGIAP